MPHIVEYGGSIVPPDIELDRNIVCATSRSRAGIVPEKVPGPRHAMPDIIGNLDNTVTKARPRIQPGLLLPLGRRSERLPPGLAAMARPLLIDCIDNACGQQCPDAESKQPRMVGQRSGKLQPDLNCPCFGQQQQRPSCLSQWRLPALRQARDEPQELGDGLQFQRPGDRRPSEYAGQNLTEAGKYAANDWTFSMQIMQETLHVSASLRRFGPSVKGFAPCLEMIPEGTEVDAVSSQVGAQVEDRRSDVHQEAADVAELAGRELPERLCKLSQLFGHNRIREVPL